VNRRVIHVVSTLCTKNLENKKKKQTNKNQTRQHTGILEIIFKGGGIRRLWEMLGAPGNEN
jgi:hypothetical protein